jgi:hypothetical protein
MKSSILRADLYEENFLQSKAECQQQITTSEDFDWGEFLAPMVALLAAMTRNKNENK